MNVKVEISGALKPEIKGTIQAMNEVTKAFSTIFKFNFVEIVDEVRK